MTNQTNTNTSAALAFAFVAELTEAGFNYRGNEYAEQYLCDAVESARSYAGDVDDFMAFMGDAAHAYDRHFNEWVDAQVPTHTAELAGLWVELGFPEPECCSGDITDQMGRAVYEAIADLAGEATDTLTELLVDFKARVEAANKARADELFSRADELAEALAEDEDEAEYEMLDRGARPGMGYSCWHWNDGERVRRFGTARAALAYSNALRGE